MFEISTSLILSSRKRIFFLCKIKCKCTLIMAFLSIGVTVQVILKFLQFNFLKNIHKLEPSFMCYMKNKFLKIRSGLYYFYVYSLLNG